MRTISAVQTRTIRTPDGAEHPATFEGRAQVGRYGEDAGPRNLPLSPASIRLTPARACPAPG